MDNKEILIGIGMKIRKLREERNMSLQEFADKLNIEYNNLIRIEKGRTNPTVGTLRKICETLKVKLVDIVNVE
ncbi:MAG: helix-turn-helix domain-containing protein [Paludibacter sp.]|nr:helix-turn-helix domain-containing protein [Paludibacter sp.]